MLLDAQASTEVEATPSSRTATARGPGRKFHHLRNLSLAPIADDEARRLLKQYGALVRKIVHERRYRLPRHAPLDHEDLLSIGNVMMLQACRDYDPTRGMKVSSWVALRVRQGVGNIVRESFGTTPEQARDHRRGLLVTAPAAPLSLDAQLSQADCSLLDTIAGPLAPADEQLEEARSLAWLREAIESPRLTPRERECVRAILAGEHLRAIGHRHGITHQRVEQLYQQAVSKLAQLHARGERIGRVRAFLGAPR